MKATYICSTPNGNVKVDASTDRSIEMIKRAAWVKHGCTIIDVIEEHPHYAQPNAEQCKNLAPKKNAELVHSA